MERSGLFALLIIANLLGVAYGYIYYSDQFASTQPIFWLFVPDSPLAALLFSIALLLPFRSDLFNFIAAIGLAKVGIWTNMVFVLFGDYFVFSSTGRFLLTIALGMLHVGMIAEAGIVLPRIITRRNLALALGWFLLNDFIDYGLGQHPYLPPGQLALTGILTMGLTFTAIFALAYLAPRLRRPLLGKIRTLYD